MPRARPPDGAAAPRASARAHWGSRNARSASAPPGVSGDFLPLETGTRMRYSPATRLPLEESMSDAMTMSYTLDQLAADIRAALKADSGRAGKIAVGRHVERALIDPGFVAADRKARPEAADPREVLYEDPELGFCICGHVYDGPAHGKPHDHGESWAIYGQASEITEMTDWKIVEKGDGGKPNLVEPLRTYTMKPGDQHLYDVGDVHSPRRDGPCRLIRIEGKNLDRVKRSNIKAKRRLSPSSWPGRSRPSMTCFLHCLSYVDARDNARQDGRCAGIRNTPPSCWSS